MKKEILDLFKEGINITNIAKKVGKSRIAVNYCISKAYYGDCPHKEARD